MQPIEYVKVDYKDRRPTTEHPARHGPDDPVSPVSITHWERDEDGVMHYFGVVADDADTTIPGVLRVISAEDWEAMTKRRKTQALDSIDTMAGEARRRFVSPGWLVEEEYRQAFEAVRAWRDAGSPLDDVPSEIQTAADYEQLDTEEAAQSIEQTAEKWRLMLSTIRELRLNGKRMVIDATAETLRNVEAEYRGLLASVGTSA